MLPLFWEILFKIVLASGALFLLWAGTGYGQNQPPDSVRRRISTEWLASPERATLLARVGADVLAEVER